MFLALLLSVLVVCGGGPRARARSTPPQPPAAPTLPPDILLIVIDDAGLSDLVAVRDAGYLPHITQLADDGYVFLNANSSPICSPTRRALFFGDFYSRQSGFGCGPATGEEPPSSAVSIAQLVRGVGYSSALIGKWHVGANPFGSWRDTVQDRGWDHWQAGVPYFVSGNAGACLGQDYSNWTDVEDGTSGPSFDYQPLVMQARFAALWNSLPSPKFVVFAAQLAHAPYHRPNAALLPPGYPATTTPRQKYEAMLAALDSQVGIMLTHVNMATTVVGIVGDNGTPEGVTTYPPERAKTTTFQGGVRVPMILSGAGIPTGSTFALTSVTDLFATIAELAGATVPALLDTRSLLPLVYGTATTIHNKIAFGIQGDLSFNEDLACRSLQYKLRRWRIDPTYPWTEEFYDLFADPLEVNNLINDPTLATKITSHRNFILAELP